MKLQHGMLLTLFALVAWLLGGCAASQARAEHDQARLAAIHAAAGEPVSSFHYMASSLYSWEPLNDNELLIYTRPNEAWLLNVGICPDLPYTVAIGLTEHTGMVNSRLDKVIVQGSNFPCHIQKIQPVDVSQLEQAMQRREGGKMVPASAASSQ